MTALTDYNERVPKYQRAIRTLISALNSVSAKLAKHRKPRRHAERDEVIALHRQDMTASKLEIGAESSS